MNLCHFFDFFQPKNPYEKYTPLYGTAWGDPILMEGTVLKAFTTSSLTRSTSVPHIPLNAGAFNFFVTTSTTNPMFSTPSFTSVAAKPVTTSQPRSTVSNIVTSPTSVSQVPTSIVPPTTTPETAPISTSEVPQAPSTTVPPFVPPTSTSDSAPVSTSVAHPFTPVTTATIYAPTTSNVTHVPVSVPLLPRASASVNYRPDLQLRFRFPLDLQLRFRFHLGHQQALRRGLHRGGTMVNRISLDHRRRFNHRLSRQRLALATLGPRIHN